MHCWILICNMSGMQMLPTKIWRNSIWLRFMKQKSSSVVSLTLAVSANFETDVLLG